MPGVLGRHHTLQLALPLFLSRVAARSVDRVAQRAGQKPPPVEEAAVQTVCVAVSSRGGGF